MEKYYVFEKWTIKHGAAFFLLLSAFICAGYYGDSDEPMSIKLSGAYFGYALFISMLMWGVINVERGRIKGKRRYCDREHNPKVFAFLMLFKTGLPSLCGLIIGFLFYIYLSRIRIRI